MDSLTNHSVVDRLTAAVAEQRRLTIRCNTAYIALARAILNEGPVQLAREAVFDQSNAVKPALIAA